MCHLWATRPLGPRWVSAARPSTCAESIALFGMPKPWCLPPVWRGSTAAVINLAAVAKCSAREHFCCPALVSLYDAGWRVFAAGRCAGRLLRTTHRRGLAVDLAAVGQRRLSIVDKLPRTSKRGAGVYRRRCYTPPRYTDWSRLPAAWRAGRPRHGSVAGVLAVIGAQWTSWLWTRTRDQISVAKGDNLQLVGGRKLINTYGRWQT